MNVNEKKIFEFVFCPDLLTVDELKIIREEKSYSPLIKFFKKLKDNKESISISTKRKIAAAIPAYSLKIREILLPISVKNNFERQSLAAETLIPSAISTETFLNDKKETIARLISSPEKKTLYIFSARDSKLFNFELTLHPSGQKIKCEDNSNPIDLPPGLKIEKIEIEF